MRTKGVLMNLLIVLVALSLTTSCFSSKRLLKGREGDKPSPTEYCSQEVVSPCDPLMSPIKDDAAKTAYVYALQYKLCKLKQELLSKCTSLREAD